MATDVDICNLALSSLADPAQVKAIDPPDGSVQAGMCARWYPIALQQMLESFDWSFAKRSLILPELQETQPRPRGQRAFRLPADCARIVAVQDLHGRLLEFEQEGDVLLVRYAAPELVYITREIMPSILPTLFVEALSLLLASFLVGPLRRSDSTSQTAQNLLQLYQVALAKAKEFDANQNAYRKPKLRVPSSIRSRWV